MSFTGLLYEQSFAVFAFTSLVLGGAASWLTGRALAATWRPLWHMLVFALLLGGLVRFIDYAVFRGSFATAYYYAVDALVCALIGMAAYQVTRAHQMRTRYAAFLGDQAGAHAAGFEHDNSRIDG